MKFGARKNTHATSTAANVSKKAQAVPVGDEFDAGVSLLVCGFDKSGANIIEIGDDEVAQNVTNDGLDVIGIGADTAEGRLLYSEHKRNDPLEMVLYDTFDAKAQAEQIQGVGYQWDAQIIIGAKIFKVPPGIKSLVEGVFEASEQSPFKNRQRAFPKNWRARLKAYAQDVLKKAST